MPTVRRTERVPSSMNECGPSSWRGVDPPALWLWLPEAWDPPGGRGISPAGRTPSPGRPAFNRWLLSLSLVHGGEHPCTGAPRVLSAAASLTLPKVPPAVAHEVLQGWSAHLRRPAWRAHAVPICARGGSRGSREVEPPGESFPAPPESPGNYRARHPSGHVDHVMIYVSR